MYKVLLIDDEAIIRKGLRNIVKWSQFGCEVCGEASDGIEGLELIEKLQPDIVFTDIRMPEMDGLEMIGKLVSDHRAIRIIILTGFSDFEYARQALVLGAFDYLLKPTNLKKISDVLERTVSELDKAARARKLSLQLKEKYYESLPKLKERFLYEVMLGIASDEKEIQKRSEKLGIGIDEFQMVLANTNCEQISEAGSSTGFGKLRTFQDMLKEYHEIQSIAIDDCNIAFVAKIVFDSKSQEFRHRCGELQQMMSQSLNMEIKISVSDKYRELASIQNAYYQCKSDLLQDNYTDAYTDNNQNKNLNYSIVILKGAGKLLLEAISCGSMDMTKESIENLFTKARITQIDDADALAILNDIANQINKILADADFKKDSIVSIDDAYKQIKILAEGATTKVEEKADLNLKQITKKAIKYLQTNYQHQITLTEVADAVYVSSYYISRIFKRETGKTMTEYLNDIRIDNACILLKDVKYKVYQVGEMVGIADAHYFSRMFKSNIGITPSEYRNKLDI